MVHSCADRIAGRLVGRATWAAVADGGAGYGGGRGERRKGLTQDFAGLQCQRAQPSRRSSPMPLLSCSSGWIGRLGGGR